METGEFRTIIGGLLAAITLESIVTFVIKHLNWPSVRFQTRIAQLDYDNSTKACLYSDRDWLSSQCGNVACA